MIQSEHLGQMFPDVLRFIFRNLIRDFFSTYSEWSEKSLRDKFKSVNQFIYFVKETSERSYVKVETTRRGVKTDSKQKTQI